MNSNFKKMIFVIAIICFFSCAPTNTNDRKFDANTEVNRRYRNSTTSETGKFTTSEYQDLIANIETEINRKIPAGMSVLINYNQSAPNCIGLGFTDKTMANVTNNMIRISNFISNSNNTADYFVYSNGSAGSELYKTKPNFILDSGFFYNTIFTEHENCAAFLIIKPNGEYLKKYGEDYFSDVKNFLEKKQK